MKCENYAPSDSSHWHCYQCSNPRVEALMYIILGLNTSVKEGYDTGTMSRFVTKRQTQLPEAQER